LTDQSGMARDSLRYDRPIELESETTHARVVALVGEHRRVLELGPATGHMSRALRDRGCDVIAIEIEPEMAAAATEYCERVIVGDLDEIDLDAELGDDRFDVIVAADVLEHLKQPLDVLRRARALLRPEGHFVISIPNIAHGSVRLALLEGRFAYQPVGLLDQGHLRFFTRESIGELLDQAELAITTIYRQELNLVASEIDFDPAAVPPELMRRLEQDPDARTYQFVIKAIPIDSPGLRELQRRFREVALESERLRSELALREAAGGSDAERQAQAQRLQAIAEREARLRSALIDAHDQLLGRDEQLAQVLGELSAMRETRDRESHQLTGTQLAELAELRDQALRLRVRIDRIVRSLPVRVYHGLGSLPILSAIISRRTAEFSAELERARRERGQGSD
jgi:2-polyprenyl-3-methyl-5-hydroxy-6-metoxy-1,4-benzoquinol methylase